MKKILLKRRRLKLRLTFEGIIIGIFSGIIIAVFRFLIDEADLYRPIYFEFLKSAQNIFLYLLTIAILFLIAWTIKKFIQIDGQIAGSGVPQIKGILLNKMKMKNPLRLIAMKFFSSILAIGSGMSLGRAGLSVQFGACIGNFFNKLLGRHQIRNDRCKIFIDGGSRCRIGGNFQCTAGRSNFLRRRTSKKIFSRTFNGFDCSRRFIFGSR